jgi:hypothetical protein
MSASPYVRAKRRRAFVDAWGLAPRWFVFGVLGLCLALASVIA